MWSGAPIVAHWSSPDPAAIGGTDEEKYAAFRRVAAQIARRVELLCKLAPEKLRDGYAVRAIGFAAPLSVESKGASTARLPLHSR